jgi:hypothetical protein
MLRPSKGGLPEFKFVPTGRARFIVDGATPAKDSTATAQDEGTWDTPVLLQGRLSGTLGHEEDATVKAMAADEVDAGRVAARPGNARDKTEPDRVFGQDEDNGDCRGCRLGRERRCVSCGDEHRNLSAGRSGGIRGFPRRACKGAAQDTVPFSPPSMMKQRVFLGRHCRR